ncbi:MAG: N-acyl homoserine lactonase family protein [Rhodospirillaceae bacterium]
MRIPEYEVYAVKFAQREARRNDHFIGGDSHDGPMPTAYYVWLIRRDDEVILVDTGFDAAIAAKRNRKFLYAPRQALGRLGVATEAIPQVVVTHLHNDHVGTLRDFPKARFHVQDDEIAFATGRHMAQEFFSRPYEVEQVVDMVRLVFERRVRFHQGDSEIAPGVQLLHVGGHTAGMQAVRVHTRRGWVVVASDSSHYYENFERRRCYPLVHRPDRMLEGYEALLNAAESPEHVIPGHDPLVMQRYASPSSELEGVAVRLDAAPKNLK